MGLLRPLHGVISPNSILGFRVPRVEESGMVIDARAKQAERCCHGDFDFRKIELPELCGT